ncbi:MAG TPA: hypothetical protein VFN51_00165 [Candidatus Saccharimonadales bacterium]|nr:hypothetical protein [Candidatus Saccharimonadales bacterium]
MTNSFIGFVYLIIGLIVASQNSYLSDLTSFPHIIAALLAIILWPLVLLGVNLHIAFLINLLNK